MANFYSTYTLKTIEFDIPPAAELFKQYSTSPEEPLNSKQIDETYQTPHNLFLKKDLALAAQQIEVQKIGNKLWMALTQQDYVIQTAIQQLRDKTKKGRIDEKTGREVEKNLLEQGKKILELLKRLEQADELLKTLIGQRNNLIDKHDQEWRDHHAKAIEGLIEVLEKNGIILSDYEKSELMKLETVPELIRKYQSINLVIPEAI